MVYGTIEQWTVLGGNLEDDVDQEISNVVNHPMSQTTPGDYETVAVDRIWAQSVAFLGSLRAYYPLYFCFLFVLLLLCVAVYAFVQPTYTAVAIIGPPDLAPISSMLTGLDAAGGSSIKRLLGGTTGTPESDPFQEYLQVLHSSGLAFELADKDNFLPRVFASRWDAAHRTWLPPSSIHNFLAPIERALNRPVTDHPDANTLADDLATRFQVAPAPSSTSAILSMGSSYMVASFRSDNPRQAEIMLSDVLSRADTIIRREQQRDVLARISYIESELPSITQADQKEALIQILSSQDELKTMMVADKRYAFAMIDPPHASPVPTSPMRPILAFLLSAIAAMGLTMAAVLLESRSVMLRTLLRLFKVNSGFATMNRATTQGQHLSTTA